MVLSSLFGAACTSSLRFGRPSVVGEDNFATGFQGFGDGKHALGKAEGGWYGTADGGKTWAKIFDGRKVEGDVHDAVLSKDGRSMHNTGDASTVADKAASYYTFNSSSATYFSFTEDLPLAFAADVRPTPVAFRGLPQPATCGDKRHLGEFGCPFRTGGRGSVRLPDGTLVMSIIIYWGGAHKSPDKRVADTATSVVAYRSADGLEWTYSGTILDAASATTSEEGPNENDLALMPDGRILCVLRLDAGDGTKSHPYRPYVRSVSGDGGRTWSRAVSLGESVGCARPRLLALGGSLLLSGGRLSRTSRDIRLWLNAAGDGAAWEAHSISYLHNRLEPNASLHFDGKINASTARESTSYTSLVATGARSGFLVYARHLPPHPDVAFAMPFTLDDEGKERELVEERR